MQAISSVNKKIGSKLQKSRWFSKFILQYTSILESTVTFHCGGINDIRFDRANTTRFSRADATRTSIIDERFDRDRSIVVTAEHRVPIQSIFAKLEK